MAVRFQLVIDCAEPDRLARFWAAALGYQLEPPPAGFTTWDDYWREVGVPEEVPVEIRRRRVDAEARRLTELGATVIGGLEQEGIDHYAVAMKDPEGNEFDIN
jgi:Glyoxalase-like domain